jgi:ribosomal protein S18 acetylase RimI-like enzyme
MMIRDATMDDFDDIDRMGVDFARAAGNVVDRETLRATIGALLETGVVKLAIDKKPIGMIGAAIIPVWWNSYQTLAQEFFWWVDPSHRKTSAGIKLLDALEKAAKKAGAMRITMFCLADVDGERIAGLYERLNYDPVERVFIKEL